MRSAALLAAVALSLPLLAQTTAKAPAIVLQAPVSRGCPVGFSARHARDGGLVAVSPREKSPEQGYSITFKPQASLGIVQARITLHGISGHQVIPAGEDPHSDVSESFTVSPFGEHDLFKSVVYVEKLTGVQSVELNELTYADGTHWHESPTSTCQVAPNGYMLVAGAR